MGILCRRGLKILNKGQNSACSCSPLFTRYGSYQITNCAVVSQKRYYVDECSPVINKVAIITGAARGIGYHIADQILDGGAQTVVLGDILIEDLQKATCKLNSKYGENKALFQACNVSKSADMERIFRNTMDKVGQLDVVINNAAILSDSSWEEMTAVNAIGAVRGTLLGFRYMGINNGGKGGFIINVASIMGFQPLYSCPIFTGTQHFLVGFSRSMGSKYFYKMTDVRVMAVCPGITDTEMLKYAGDEVLQGFGDLGIELSCSLRSQKSQGPEKVGETVIKMLKAKENGSVWVSEGGEMYKAKFPDKSTLKPGKKPCKRVGSVKKKDPPKEEEEDPCKMKKNCKKADPDKKKKPCKKEDPCEKKEPCKQEDPCKKMNPCKEKGPCEDK